MGKLIKDVRVRNAVFIGILCSVSYLAVYFARNILSAVSPKMVADGFTNEFIGGVSSLYFISYGIGQLINGAIGDKIKAKYMISFGLILAGVCNALFTSLSMFPLALKISYALTGFFLSMIYGPMTKVVAENTDPKYVVRCSLGYTFSSFFGTPMAGIVAVFFTWQSVFAISSAALVIMGAVCFFFFSLFEKMGVVRYNLFKKEKEKGKGVKILIKRGIIKYTFVSIITGIVRTTVVFWLPAYITQYLGFSADTSAKIFTVVTLIISFSAFVSVSIYEFLKQNLSLTVFVGFCGSALAFLVVSLVKIPIVNIIFIVIAILMSNCAVSMVFSRYCPSLRDTGMVSTAAGFLDFMSYVAASVSSIVFANAVSTIGWSNLVLIWFGLVLTGAIISIPVNKKA